jgi:CBS-domain-containing membrane protein
MSIDFFGFDKLYLMRNKNSGATVHLVAPFLRERRAPQGHGMLLGERATRPIRPPSGALALLQILAIPKGIAAVCALPVHPMTTCSGASNYRF